MRLPATAALDGWSPARASGCTEPGLQASSPAARPLTCGCGRDDHVHFAERSRSGERVHRVELRDYPTRAAHPERSAWGHLTVASVTRAAGRCGTGPAASGGVSGRRQPTGGMLGPLAGPFGPSRAGKGRHEMEQTRRGWSASGLECGALPRRLPPHPCAPAQDPYGPWPRAMGAQVPSWPWATATTGCGPFPSTAHEERATDLPRRFRTGVRRCATHAPGSWG